MAKRKSHEISEEQYKKAIAWLENKGTKKGACEILKVSANKTMERLIEEFIDGQANSKRLRAKKRATAMQDPELVEIIMDYLNGFSLSELSDRHFRSIDIIKYHLDKCGAMLRHIGSINPLNPPVLPDQCFEQDFEEGQYVWSAKYGCVAQIKAKYKNAWRIQVMGNGREEQAYQAASELGSLKHLETIGVNLAALGDFMSKDEVNDTINKTMYEANKRHKQEAK